MRRIFLRTFLMACRMLATLVEWHAGLFKARGRLGDRALVECVFDHGVPVLVWGGRLFADTARKLCCQRGSAAGGAMRRGRRAVVFLFLTRVLLPHERELTADETSVVGVVAGFHRHSRRRHWRSCVRADGRAPLHPARSEDGKPIQKEEEVFVARYEKGVAYVRRWEEVLENRE